MKRKEFLKKGLISTAVASVAPTMLKAKNVRLKESDYDKLIEPIGFNHLPNKEEKTMNTVVHKSDSRGQADHGWLQSRHSFSFANYYNPDRVHFGVLRVLNDDVVAGGKGFGTHPHDNMEIISIPLEGAMEHKDSMGNTSVIKAGDIQVMSAGTGIFHSEYNKMQDETVKFLQIWLFPNRKNVTPRYDQISLNAVAKENELYQVLSPSKDDQGVWIHQDAWFHMGNFNQTTDLSYELKKQGNGVYFFVLEGEVSIEDQALSKRDGMGVWDVDQVQIKASKGARLLAMEVPMVIG